MALKTYADWEDAVRMARVDYDHSQARIVHRTKTVRRSRKMAFLSVLATTCTPSYKLSSFPRRKSKTVKDPERRIAKQPKVENRKIQILIATPLASTICLQLSPSTSISALKGILQDRLGIEPEKQQLFTRNNFELCGALSLEDHSIQQDTNLELRLVAGLMGGKRRRRSGKKGNTDVKPSTEASPSVSLDAGERQQDTLESHPTPPEGAAASEQPPNTSTATTAVSISGSGNRVTIGDTCTYNFYGLPMEAYVSREGKKDDFLTTAVISMLKLLERLHGQPYVRALFSDLYGSCDAEHDRVESGSVKFFVRVKSRKGLDKLWTMFRSGELAKKLAKIIITNDLTTEDKSDLALQVTILETDYQQGCIFFEKLNKEPARLKLPSRMLDWTKEHVKYWLLDIGVVEAIANQLHGDNIDGKVLKMYTREDLKEDCDMITKRDMRLILYSRDSWLQSEEEFRRSSVTDDVPVETQGHLQELSSGAFKEPSIRNIDEIPPPSVRPKTTKPQVKIAPIHPDPVQVGPDEYSESDGDFKRVHSSEDHGAQARSSTRVKPEYEARAVPFCKVKPMRASMALSDDKPKDANPPQSDEQEDSRIYGQQELQSLPVTSDNKVKSPRPFATIKERRAKEAKPHAKSPSAHLSEGTQNYEARLRLLLTGDERGELDQSYFPVLVANQPSVPDPQRAPSGTDAMSQQFGFVKTIKWTAVLDFNSKSLVDGLCKLYHDDRMVTLQQPDLFRDIDSEEEFRNSIEFPEKTLWVFANGREDNPSIKSPHMELPEWNKERSRDVEESIRFFSKASVIPEGRAMIMFLLLSDQDIGILCDTFRKLASSFRGLQNITCVAEDQEIYSKFLDYAGRWFSKEEIDARSVVGLRWHGINHIMMRMNGVNQINENTLPSSLPERSCPLSEKKKDEWNDLIVLCKNECKNTDMDSSNPSYKQFAQRKELNFYHGEKVDWWNFAIGDTEKKKKTGCGHVLTRNRFEETLKKVTKPLKRSEIEDSLIVTVTILHQPGAGGSTLARHVLWKLHKEYRCVVVNRVTSNTVDQIMEVRRYGYEDYKGKIPPVCVLIDDLEDVELLDLIAELEEVSRNVCLNGGAVCVLLHCKRNVDPIKFINTKGINHMLYIPLTQKLEPEEKAWFQRKYDELERKEKELQTGDYIPDNLLAFMVMKEEFSKDYITNVVSRILSDVEGNELQLIKLCAFLNSYMHDADIPIPCCDALMADKLTSRRTTYLPHQSNLPRWEKLVSASFKMLVVITENRTIKIFHKSIAEETLRQALERNGCQSLAEVTDEFLNSELLSSRSFTRKNLAKTTHDLLIRRERLGHGEDAKTDFSVLIEDICRLDGRGTAIEILKIGVEKLEDAFVAQQLARLYLKEKDFKMAHKYADKALKINPQNSYFWDTKGRIYQTHFNTLSAPCVIDQQVLSGDVCKNVISLSFLAMDTFRKSFEVSKKALQSRTEYTGLYAELNVAFKLLQIIHLCVEPFRTRGDINILRKYLLNLEMPRGTGDPEWDSKDQSRIRELKVRVDTVLEIMNDRTTYYKDGSSANVVGQKLDEMRENMKKYSKIYEQYYGEPVPFQRKRYSDRDPTSLAEYQRRKAIQLQCGSFREIFDLARANNWRNLEESRKLLLQNSSNFNSFDLKILICIHLALSSMGKLSVSADDVYKDFVRPFLGLDGGESCWPPFLMMMFLWPIPGQASERRDRYDLTAHTEELKRRWNGGQDFMDHRLLLQDKGKRHIRSEMKPKTHFFLGRGDGLRVFAHINELHATQAKLDRREAGDDTFWQSDRVKDRLVLLEGTLLNATSLLYSPRKDKKPINVKLAAPYTKYVPSQEAVTFYLGFSWYGPVAYNVTTKGQESRDETVQRSFHQAYPKHLLPSDKSKTSLSDSLSNIDRLQRDCQDLIKKLEEPLPSSQDRGRQKQSKEEISNIRKTYLRELKRKRDELRCALEEDSYDDGF